MRSLWNSVSFNVAYPLLLAWKLTATKWFVKILKDLLPDMAAWHLLVFDHQQRPFQKNFSKLFQNQVIFLLNLLEKWSLFNWEIWRTSFCQPLHSPISGAMQLGSSHKFSFKLTKLLCLDWKIADNYSYIEFLESNYASFKPYADILKKILFSNAKLAPNTEGKITGPWNIGHNDLHLFWGCMSGYTDS